VDKRPYLSACASTDPSVRINCPASGRYPSY
jgi:hypothetical protein